MRLFGWQLTAARAQPPASADGKASVPIAIATSQRSYDSPLGIDFTNQVKCPVELALYDLLVAAFPFLDRGLRTLARMAAPFEFECENETTGAAMQQWAEDVRVGYLFRGFNSWLRPYIRQSLQYGKTAGELVLAPSKRDIEALFVVDAKRIRLIRDDKEGLLLGEDNRVGMPVPYPAQDLFVYMALNSEGDNPHGVSLMRSIPYVADIVLRMETAVRQMWQRHGAPSFLLHYNIPGDTVLPGPQVNAIRDTIQDDWLASQKARGNNEGIMDFVAATQGVLTMTAVGSDVHELNFSDVYRNLMEQIVSSIDLAPFMLGLQWATTERLSQQQADVIIGTIEDMRHELTPDLLHIADWVQRTQGLRGKVAVAWADVNLQDRVQSAQAEREEAQAQKLRTENALTSWANGWTDQVGAKSEAGYEDETIDVEMDAPVMPQSSSGAPAGLLGAAGRAAAQWRDYPG